MPTSTMPSVYDPAEHEKTLYTRWERSGFFNPDTCVARGITSTNAAPFSIVLPPPNVTGVLHTGHAAMLAIEDALVRYHRMKGDRTLWIPGTDHAAIATQSKVEKILKKETGQTRHDIGRDAFLAKVHTFAQESHDTIVNQCRAMGASLDWSRETFTLDAVRSNAVTEAFRRMYDDGLIYRGDRIVNWDPVGQTTISDDEVVYEERTATLYTFRYSADFPIPIATTRPETKIGDTAVAVHPDDPRYSAYIGQTFVVDHFCGVRLTIRIIADKDVDPTFGTGALGVTPAHSAIDWDMAQRHNLPCVPVIDEHARMLAGDVVGQDVQTARTTIVAWLRDHALLLAEEPVTQNVATAERTGAIIEPLPKKQWFVDVHKTFTRDNKVVTLKSLMHDAVKSGAVTIVPDRFGKVYSHWIDNLRDWCISRQIWYGHRVPVWYRGTEILISDTAPNGTGWEQDPDTLDTWFSSGLWTFSTLGWPATTTDLRTYHPTTLLETGYDILFFWVARMILMSTYLIGDVPFRTVYLHGLVRDEQGRKMSKSLGNAINPLDVTKTYGTDAVRSALVFGSTPGNDVRLGENKIAAERNFTNKLWNIGRYVTSMSVASDAPVKPQTVADHWILARLHDTIIDVTNHMEAYRLSQAGEVLRDFTWGDFADWYVEVHKITRNDAVLRFVFDQLLRLWHPFLPFVTEVLWSYCTPRAQTEDAALLLVAPWPRSETCPTWDPAYAKQFTHIRSLIVAIRMIRATYRLTPEQKPDLACDAALFPLAHDAHDLLRRLARVANIQEVTTQPEGSALCTTPCGSAYVCLSTVIDLAKERARLIAERDTLTRHIAEKNARLTNQQFVDRAPEHIVAQERSLLATLEQRHAECIAALATLM